MSTTLVICTASAFADVQALEVKSYSDEFNVSGAVAKERLDVQSRGTEADIVGGLEHRLDGDYAGVWFDNASGEFVIPLTPGASRGAVASELIAADLDGSEFRTAQAQSSLEELEAAQEKIDAGWDGLVSSGQLRANVLRTGLDIPTNSVSMLISSDASEVERAAVKRLIGSVEVRVELQRADEEQFEMGTSACDVTDRVCDLPLRGGTYMTSGERFCSTAFSARDVSGNRYVLTAGHCIKEPADPSPLLLWSTTDSCYCNDHFHTVGTAEQWHFPGNDWAKLNVAGQWPSISPWPTQVAFWGQTSPEYPWAQNLNYPINGQGQSYIGQTVCHSGANTGGSCGTVVAMNETLEYSPSEKIHGLTLARGKYLCVGEGDSGGPVFAANTALGILSGGGQWAECYEPQKALPEMAYAEISEATKELGVYIVPTIEGSPTPHVTAEVTPLNGNPGWVTVKGQVTVPGATLNNLDINVKLFKWEGNGWVEKATLPTKVNNNSYEIANWNGVGVGSWIAKAVVPAQGGIAESTSDDTHEGSFTIKDGYRLVSKNSGKCLDVSGASKENTAPLQQYDCLNPATSQNQVFTLVPQGAYVQLVARHSGRCVDVVGASQSNGAKLQQYTCGSQANQLWQVVPAGGEYSELRAKHSGKCMDVYNASTANTAPIQQWDCLGNAQQKWSFQSVESAPIPTETFITVPEGETMNGQPGYVSVNGYVKTGAYGVGGSSVTIHYEKEVSANTWQELSKRTTTLNSEGGYSYPFEGVSVGKWRAWTSFGGVGNLAGSSSPAQKFEIKSGYHLVARNSNKCMTLWGNYATNGTAIVQWYCFVPPNPGDGQVFTLVPQGGGYFNVKVNSTGKCVDVTGASSENGAWLQEWDCFSPATANQLWQVVPIQGQSPWFAFIAKHSGKCADVVGGSTADSTRIQQWACTWAAQQQWKFEPVN